MEKKEKKSKETPKETRKKRKEESVAEKKEGPIEVYLKCNIFSIREIDTVQQTFTCDFFLEASWKDEKWRGKTQDDIDGAKELAYTFINLISSEREESWTRKYNKDDDAIIFRLRFIGKFAQRFNLKYFPFDKQNLHILITSKKAKEAMLFRRHTGFGKGDIVCTDEVAFTLAEWHLWNHVETQFGLTDPNTSSSGVTYPHYVVTLHVTRTVTYYIYNVMVIMFLLVMMAATSFAVPLTDAGGRLSVSLTLVLTSVAFKFSTAQNIPKVGYNTYLDVYLFVCFAFLSLIVAENAVVARLNLSQRDENIFIIAIGSLWVLFTLIEVVLAIFFVTTNNHQMGHKDHAFAMAQQVRDAQKSQTDIHVSTNIDLRVQ